MIGKARNPHRLRPDLGQGELGPQRHVKVPDLASLEDHLLLHDDLLQEAQRTELELGQLELLDSEKEM